MAKYYTILTDYGVDLVNKHSLSGEPFVTSGWYIALGTGMMTPSVSMTSLVNKIYDKYSANYPGITFGNDEKYGRFAQITIPDSLSGYVITELGLFDANDNLVMVANTNINLNTSIVDGIANIFTAKMSLFAIPANIDIIYINEGNYVTVEDLSGYQKLNEKSQPNGYAPLNEKSFVPKEHLASIQYVPFCVNSGPMENGVETVLTLNENIITAHSPFVVTSADGVTREINQDINLDVSELAEGTYQILFNFETNLLEAFSGSIYTDKKFPDDAQVGDMLFDISVLPYTSKVKTEDGYNLKQYALMGQYDCISGGGGSITISPYNQNLGGSSSGSSSKIGDPIFTLNSILEENEIWLEGATVSRETYSKLFEVYGTTYGKGDGSTTFGLPDFRDRAIWGSNQFGYIGAGLPNITGTFGDIIQSVGSGASGAFNWYSTNSQTNANAGVLQPLYNVDFYASRSSSIYGNSDTVQPPSIKVRVKTRYK